MPNTERRSGAKVAEPYVPPTGDEPLDVREVALVRALARIIVRQIQAEAATTQDSTLVAIRTRGRVE